MNTYLLKLAELTLKGGNREEFEKLLRNNIQAILKGHSVQLQLRNGRIYVHGPQEHAAFIESSLSHVIGISGWAKAKICKKNLEDICKTCVEEVRLLLFKYGYKTFKVEARRSDKTFSYKSYDLMKEAGAAILEAFPELQVDVHNPDLRVDIEVREHVYVYGEQTQGHRGLPPGCSGKGLLLLSGGIDSPVAGFRLAKRGMRVDAVYFHAWPYTSKEAMQKVEQLAQVLSRYTMGMRLHIIDFAPVQLAIKNNAPAAWTTVLSRMAMMQVADRIARRTNAKCLITGESLGQVASQTLNNMHCTESKASLQVLRPLIAMDKIEIIQEARKIGTYDISILPYPDCCIVFSPEHPVIHAKLEEATSLYDSVGLKDLIKRAIETRMKKYWNCTGILEE